MLYSGVRKVVGPRSCLPRRRGPTHSVTSRQEFVNWLFFANRGVYFPSRVNSRGSAVTDSDRLVNSSANA